MDTFTTTDIKTREDEGGAGAGRLAALPTRPNWPAETITAGSIFIEKSAHLPNSVVYENGSDVTGWAMLKGPQSTFEKKLGEAGWTLFFMAGEIKVTALGSDPETLRTALKRLIANVKSQQCNGLEISQVARHRLLGVPYLRVTAHPRHLQRGLVFAGRPGLN